MKKKINFLEKMSKCGEKKIIRPQELDRKVSKFNLDFPFSEMQSQRNYFSKRLNY